MGIPRQSFQLFSSNLTSIHRFTGTRDFHSQRRNYDVIIWSELAIMPLILPRQKPTVSQLNNAVWSFVISPFSFHYNLSSIALISAMNSFCKLSLNYIPQQIDSFLALPKSFRIRPIRAFTLIYELLITVTRFHVISLVKSLVQTSRVRWS